LASDLDSCSTTPVFPMIHRPDPGPAGYQRGVPDCERAIKKEVPKKGFLVDESDEEWPRLGLDLKRCFPETSCSKLGVENFRREVSSHTLRGENLGRSKVRHDRDTARRSGGDPMYLEEAWIEGPSWWNPNLVPPPPKLLDFILPHQTYRCRGHSLVINFMVRVWVLCSKIFHLNLDQEEVMGVSGRGNVQRPRQEDDKPRGDNQQQNIPQAVEETG
jgi:hypothetical protein